MAGCSKITDVSLKLLRQCHLLEKLDIRECRSITDEGCEKFLDPNHHYDDYYYPLVNLEYTNK